MELRSGKMVSKIKKDDSSRSENQENVKESDDKQSHLPNVNLIDEVPNGNVNEDLSKPGSLTKEEKRNYIIDMLYNEFIQEEKQIRKNDNLPNYSDIMTIYQSGLLKEYFNQLLNKLENIEKMQNEANKVTNEMKSNCKANVSSNEFRKSNFIENDEESSHVTFNTCSDRTTAIQDDHISKEVETIIASQNTESTLKGNANTPLMNDLNLKNVLLEHQVRATPNVNLQDLAEIPLHIRVTESVRVAQTPTGLTLGPTPFRDHLNHNKESKKFKGRDSDWKSAINSPPKQKKKFKVTLPDNDEVEDDVGENIQMENGEKDEEITNERRRKFIENKEKKLLKRKFTIYQRNLAIGTHGANILAARDIEDIKDIQIDKPTHGNDELVVFKNFANNKDATKKARTTLEYKTDEVKTPKNMVGKMIGKQGKTIQDIIDKSETIRVQIGKEKPLERNSDDNILSNNDKPDFVDFVFTRTSENIANAENLINFHSRHLQEMDEKREETDDVSKQLHSKPIGDIPSREYNAVLRYEKFNNESKFNSSNRTSSRHGKPYFNGNKKNGSKENGHEMRANILTKDDKLNNFKIVDELNSDDKKLNGVKLIDRNELIMAQVTQKNGDVIEVPIVPSNKVNELLNLSHDLPGHVNNEKLFKKLIHKAYFKNIRKKIAKFTKKFEMVLIERNKKTRDGKFELKYRGPFKILQVNPTTVVVRTDAKRGKNTMKVHKTQVKHFKQR